MKKKVATTLILVILLLAVSLPIAEASEKNIVIRIKSKIHPKYIIAELKSKLYLLYFNIGKYYFKAGKINMSIRMFIKTTKVNPKFAPAYHNLGVAYYKKGEIKKAINEFKKSIEVDQRYVKGHYSLGILYFQLGNFTEAIKSLSKVVELEPENPNVNFDLGQSYVARFRKNEEKGNPNFKDLEMGLKYLKKTEEIKPGFPHALNNIKIIESILKARKELTSSK